MQPLRSFSTAPEPATLINWDTGNPLFLSPPDTFPVVCSSLAPHALSHFVFAHYDIEVPRACRFWHRGLSDVYWLETWGNNYILRISHHHWRTQSEIEFELEFLLFLSQRGLPVAAPLRSQQGHFYLTLNAPEGPRYGALFPVAPGSVAIGDLNPTQANILGQTLAQLHLQSQDFTSYARRSPLTPFYLIDESLHILAPFLEQRQEDWQYLINTSLYLKNRFKCLPTNEPYWGVCWGDPHSGNVHFTADNQPTLFDFDQCGQGWRAFDVAKFLQVSLQTGLCRAVREAFLKGYQSLTPLSPLEIDCLQALTQTAYLWSWGIQVNALQLNDYSRLSPNYFSQRLGRLKQLGSPDWQLF